MSPVLFKKVQSVTMHLVPWNTLSSSRCRKPVGEEGVGEFVVGEAGGVLMFPVSQLYWNLTLNFSTPAANVQTPPREFPDVFNFNMSLSGFPISSAALFQLTEGTVDDSTDRIKRKA
jgi:hypothetical protein